MAKSNKCSLCLSFFESLEGVDFIHSPKEKVLNLLKETIRDKEPENNFFS